MNAAEPQITRGTSDMFAPINASGAADFRWRSLVTPTYTLGNAQAGLRWKIMPRTSDVTCVTSSCAATTASVGRPFLGYSFGNVRRFTARIDNLMNRQPPVVGGIPGNTMLANTI
jgi:hypothetical protein